MFNAAFGAGWRAGISNPHGAKNPYRGWWHFFHALAWDAGWRIGIINRITGKGEL